MKGQSSPICLLHLCPKRGQPEIANFIKGRLRISWGSVVKLGQPEMYNSFKKVRLRISWGIDVRLGLPEMYNSFKEVILRISWGSDVKLGHLIILRVCSDVRMPIQGRETSPLQLCKLSFRRETRFRNPFSGRDSKSLISSNSNSWINCRPRPRINSWIKKSSSWIWIWDYKR